MDKSSEIVPERQLEEDILFIEGEHVTIESRETELTRMIVTQALTIEEMLNKGNSKR
jgi:hypothetical protein